MLNRKRHISKWAKIGRKMWKSDAWTGLQISDLIPHFSPDGILCFDEGFGLVAIRVLHPTVRVSHLKSWLQVKFCINASMYVYPSNLIDDKNAYSALMHRCTRMCTQVPNWRQKMPIESITWNLMSPFARSVAPRRSRPSSAWGSQTKTAFSAVYPTC